MVALLLFVFFFFQAEDGIRDYKVTGVQTCALPICRNAGRLPARTACLGCSPDGTGTPGGRRWLALAAQQRRIRCQPATAPAGPIVAKGASACYARANRRPGQTTGIRICQAMSAGSGGRGCVDRIDAMSSDAAQDRPTPQDLTPPASAAAFAAGSAQSSPAADLRSGSSALVLGVGAVAVAALIACGMLWQRDRKSTRLNSS